MMVKKNGSSEIIDSKTRIGHVHLKVSDLERAVNFYRGVLGFEVTAEVPGAAFLSAGGYHHHIGLNTWESKGAEQPPRRSTGLYHFAILVPNRKGLAKVLKRLQERGWPIEGTADHGVSEAIYLKDPDGNGIEVYADRPRKKWPKTVKGEIEMYTRPLDLESLMRAVGKK